MLYEVITIRDPNNVDDGNAKRHGKDENHAVAILQARLHVSV